MGYKYRSLEVMSRRSLAELRLGTLCREPALEIPANHVINFWLSPRAHQPNSPERFFLRQKLLPLLVDLALDTKLDLAQLNDPMLARKFETLRSSFTFSSSLRSCSSLRRTLWLASSSGRIEESLFPLLISASISANY